MITQRTGWEGKHVVLKDWELRVQPIDKVPDIVTENSPAPVSPRKILQGSWPNEGRDFVSYTIRPAGGKEVHGTLWELTKEERELVRNWELIDFGWYKDAKVKVILDDGTELEVQTEVLGDGQEIDEGRVIDGRDYPNFLNPIEDFRRSTVESYNAYSRAKEGSVTSQESKA